MGRDGREGRVPVWSVVGWSGVGKTTLLERLVPALKARGLRVAVVKHDAHQFDIDHPGKDTWRMRRAGADVVAIASASRAAVMEERPVALEDLIDRIVGVDVILTEGAKHGPWRKIALRRGTIDLPPGPWDAIVSDVPMETDVSVFALDDIPGLADMIEASISTPRATSPRAHPFT
ncbi:MAG: molybdopterin-guanine dinucleotide biosynthesis protein B [Synergistaceae bacterium]|nr:molybdopterin-guanine dinucleotide biosynthesis protein B [Synergistaceae bacterium]